MSKLHLKSNGKLKLAEKTFVVKFAVEQLNMMNVVSFSIQDDVPIVKALTSNSSVIDEKGLTKHMQRIAKKWHAIFAYAKAAPLFATADVRR